ncbi:hypothetical protein BD410DRAFT_847105 [Rickenella mellea]|uniref:JmjC domain-containing protein n=1 Tax=Rickenella mellea TaxID=50990 RepID=A0A4Y7PE68_9AGAM|nr:hypothetical protein BD410DRAFT_847105 [Rickenella mellea]
MWKDEKFKLLQYKVQSFMKSSVPILRDLLPEGGEFAWCILTLTRGEWNARSRSEKLSILAQHPAVHVIGKDGQWPIMPEVKSWDPEMLGLYLDPFHWRQTHDMLQQARKDWPNDRIGEMDLVSLYGAMNKPERTSIFNMLDIPLLGSRIALPVSSVEAGGSLHHSGQREHHWASAVHLEALMWALVALAGAVSESHMDASGFATFVRIVLGEKLWCIAFDCKAKQLKMEAIPDASRGWKDEEMRWQGILLKEGDDLYMAPGTPHYVFTTKDSLCVGGHFYCKALFSDTLRAITLEHFMGMSLTNIQHSSSPFLCVKILASYCEALRYRPDNEHIAKLGDFPTWRELAHLVTLVANLNNLISQPAAKPKDDDDEVTEEERILWESDIWQNNGFTFWADRPKMLKLIAQLPRLIHEDEFYDALQEVEDWYFPFVKACGDNVYEDEHRRRFVPKLLAARLRESRDNNTKITFPPEHAAAVNIEHGKIQKPPRKVAQKPAAKKAAGKKAAGKKPAKVIVVKPAVERPQRKGRSARRESSSDKGEGPSTGN